MPVQQLSAVALALLLTATAASAKPFELSFWPSEDARNDPRVIRMDPHPCGEVAIAKVMVIPPFRKGAALTPERVLETNSAGRVVRRWWLPTDATIRAIRGDTLTVQYDSKLFSVRPGGHIEEAAMVKFQNDIQRPSCKVPSELLPSDYAVCEVFSDTMSNRPRQLAYEGICT